MKRFYLYASLISIFVCSGVARSQLATDEALRECGISPEVLAVIGCVSSDASLIITKIETDVQWRLLLETLQENLVDARVVKQSLLEQLSSVDSAEDFDSLQSDIHAAANTESSAMNAYQDEVDNIVMKISAVLTSIQEASLELVLREQVSMLPPEYRLLDWSDRRLQKLARALKMDGVNQHLLLLEADSIYAVQLAKQNLLHQRNSIAAILDASS